jgi:catechol 2,3-dioxygenase-like lactoylglutathione lyase family enzyme
MRDISLTRSFYRDTLGFQVLGEKDRDYLMVGRDGVEIHLFLFPGLHAEANYGMCYIRLRNKIEELYHRLGAAGVIFTDLGRLERKPWGHWEFSVIDPDHNLITFGQACRRGRKK